MIFLFSGGTTTGFVRIHFLWVLIFSNVFALQF